MLAGLSLDPLYKAVGWLLAVFYSVPPAQLGIAIILLTFAVMLVQFPLIAKQTRSMIQMQRVQPEIKKIQQQYKDDRAKQNEELLKFYQENKINPIAGCLPILVTLPIGIAGVSHVPQGRADPPSATARARLNGLYSDCVHLVPQRGRSAPPYLEVPQDETSTVGAVNPTVRDPAGGRVPALGAVLSLDRAGGAHRLVSGQTDPGPPDSPRGAAPNTQMQMSHADHAGAVRFDHLRPRMPPTTPVLPGLQLLAHRPAALRAQQDVRRRTSSARAGKRGDGDAEAEPSDAGTAPPE